MKRQAAAAAATHEGRLRVALHVRLGPAGMRPVRLEWRNMAAKSAAMTITFRHPAGKGGPDTAGDGHHNQAGEHDWNERGIDCRHADIPS